MNLKLENKEVNIDENLKNLIKSQIEGEVYIDEISREITTEFFHPPNMSQY